MTTKLHPASDIDKPWPDNLIIDDRMAGLLPGGAVRRAMNHADRDALVERFLTVLETVDIGSAPLSDLTALVAFLDALEPRCQRLTPEQQGGA